MSTTTTELVSYEDPSRDHRAGRGRRVLGRLHRQHPDQLHDRPAHLRRLVPRQPADPARRATRASGDVRPLDGGTRVGCARRSPAACRRWPASTATAHAEGIVARDPAANVRRPKVDHESRTLGLDRNELGALLVQAGLGTPRDHALVTLLAMNGLRISEALERRRRRPRHRTRSSHAADRAQGRQARHHPTRATHRTGARPVHR